MRRRDFIKVIAAPAMGWPLAARAQSSTKMARIGMLYIGLADAESFKKELREALRELGYVEGQNIAFEFRSAEGKLDRLPGLASELVRLPATSAPAGELGANCSSSLLSSPTPRFRSNVPRPGRPLQT
jgi:putative ABC transport system substrate-binding protein